MRISDWSSDVCSSDLQALARLQPGGIVVASAANDAGAKSHEADLARIAGPLVSRSKHKCRVFWTRPGAEGGDAALATKWRELDAPRPIHGGRLPSRPGVFAWDRIDAASALLAEQLPPYRLDTDRVVKQ